MARLASPRTTKADPLAAGETTLTSGKALMSAATLCHWSMLLKRCRGDCTMLSSKVGLPEWPRLGNARATSLGGSSWMWACPVKTRLTKLACRPLSKADMNTITPTPIATPPMMKAVCTRPSRKNRRATHHSNGIQDDKPTTAFSGWAGVFISRPGSRRAECGLCRSRLRWQWLRLGLEQPAHPTPRSSLGCAGPI